MLSINVDTYALENKLYLLAKAARVEPGQVIKEEARLVTQNIIQLTPPKALAQGRKRILGDMSRVVQSLDHQKIDWKPLKTAVEKKNRPAIEALLRNKRSGPRELATSIPIIQGEHLRRRNRYGRVGNGKPVYAALNNIAGKYLRDVQSRVGWAKGSWVSALVAAGGRAPNWYARHAAVAGTAIANFGENPQFTATARNIKIPNFQRVADSAVRNRERVTQKKIDRVVAGKAVNLGFVTILERT